MKWVDAVVRGVLGGLALGGIALLLDFEVDVLAIVLAVALGGVLGEDAVNAWIVRRYERGCGATVYRVEDPPGTEAGLAVA